MSGARSGLWGLSALLALVMATGHARGAELTLVNSSSLDLVALYVIPCGSGSWGESLILKPLRPGQTLGFDLSPGSYDLMVVTEGQETIAEYGWDLQEDATWEIWLDIPTASFPGGG
ncbi:hypothetical protein JW921_01320 [Candidatus Fermentibacterales bacterium]|nr:hypothetical protein [Candidatus Fermentibacterales bacterium]